MATSLDKKKKELLESIKECTLTASIIDAFVQEGGDIDGIYDGGHVGHGCHTPLAYALALNNDQMAQLLLENGANAKAKDGDGMTAMHWVTTKEMVELLVEKGANVDEKNSHGKTPLYQMLHGDDYEIDVMIALIEHGAHQHTALYEATSLLAHYSSYKEEYEEAMKLAFCCLVHGGDLLAKDSDGKTPYDCIAGINNALRPYYYCQTRINELKMMLEQQNGKMQEQNEKIQEMTDLVNQLLIAQGGASEKKNG